MKQKVVVVVVSIAVLLVLSLFIFRSKETYILPDAKAGPDICPPGFSLMCVLKTLAGVEDIVPFPSSLPYPCEQTHSPLCLPSPENTMPPKK